ncbi:MAG: CBS domain-containing protein [Planctomycetales bacterium]|nr:CBS domain-containing protein [Planctomycetales bacterium]
MGLQENMQQEPVSRLALRDPVTATAETPLREAIGRMRDQGLGCTVVVDEEGKPVGMFTESMLTQLLAQEAANMDDAVARHMAHQWPWVHVTDPIVHVLEAMELKNVRFLCVVDADGRLIGLTGQKGLMEYVADHFPGQVMVQRIGGKPYPQDREGA